MNHASLFSGIGGFDLAAQWMRWNNIFQVEKDEWCQGVLAKHFPNTDRHLDIRGFNGKKYKGSIDVISGGFPCQPFSVAGKQKGKNDDRYLWPEMLRVIREIQPTWVVGENVPGIVSLALDTVLADLEVEGYAVQAFIIPACAINAVHKRDRVWILANAKHNVSLTTTNGRPIRDNARTGAERSNQLQQSQGTGFVSNTTSEQSQSNDVRETWATQQIKPRRRDFQKPRLTWPVSQPTIRRGDDGVSYRLDDSRLITPKQRTNSLKQLGNSVVPQLVYEIFRMIKKKEF